MSKKIIILIILLFIIVLVAVIKYKTILSLVNYHWENIKIKSSLEALKPAYLPNNLKLDESISVSLSKTGKATLSYECIIGDQGNENIFYIVEMQKEKVPNVDYLKLITNMLLSNITETTINGRKGYV